jgi:hypothetical protein
MMCIPYFRLNRILCVVRHVQFFCGYSILCVQEQTLYDFNKICAIQQPEDVAWSSGYDIASSVLQQYLLLPVTVHQQVHISTGGAVQPLLRCRVTSHDVAR